MELSNEFTVSLPPEEAFAVLTDVGRIAPCLPGAELQEVRGEEYLGAVKVKVGPITAQYKGVARFLELDAEALKAVLRAEGRDTRGQGNANATITASLEPAGDGTKVTVRTDLAITGKVAQFGRGVLADVSAKLLGQFADCLESTIAAVPAGPPAAGAMGAEEQQGAPAGDAGGAGTPSATAGSGSVGSAATTAATATAPPPPPRQNAPVDLLELAGGGVLKRAAPLAGVLAAVLAVVIALRARLRRRHDDA